MLQLLEDSTVSAGNFEGFDGLDSFPLHDLADAARRIVDFEKELASGHWDVVASRDAVRTYRRGTWLLAALYGVKGAVQLILWQSGAVAALGIVKLVMGLPLFALVVWVIWLMHRALLHRRGDVTGRR